MGNQRKDCKVEWNEKRKFPNQPLFFFSGGFKPSEKIGKNRKKSKNREKFPGGGSVISKISKISKVIRIIV